MSVVFTPASLFLVASIPKRGVQGRVIYSCHARLANRSGGCRRSGAGARLPPLLPARVGPEGQAGRDRRHRHGQAPSWHLARRILAAAAERGRDQCSPALPRVRCVSEATQNVPMSHPFPAAPAPLVLWRPQQTRAPNAPGTTPGRKSGDEQGREQTRGFARIERFSRLQEIAP